MKKMKYKYIYTIFLVLLCSCSVNKFIPEQCYLLNEVSIESDTKKVNPSLFTSYIRQNPNAKWFNLIKVPMRIYCLSGQDSAHSFNKFLKKLGDAPIIYDSILTRKSQREIEKAVKNMGYMRARVYLDTIIRNKKLDLNYRIEAGNPYTIESIDYQINDSSIWKMMKADSEYSLLSEKMPFDVVVLDNERQRIAKLLQRNGYYRFNKDFLVYQADTIKDNYTVNLTMKLLPYQKRKEDEPTQHKQYEIRNVNFWFENNMMTEGNMHEEYDSIYHEGFKIYFHDKLPLRPNVLKEFNYIRPNNLYNEQDIQNTYASMGRLRALKYCNIQIDDVQEGENNCLDANVLLTRTKPQSLSFEIEGTNSAGDLGAAASLTYQHRNVFKGSETLTMKVRGAFEAITGLQEGYENDDYKEYGIDANLNFTEFKFPFLSSDFKRRIRATSEVGVKFNSQIRPEFIRTLASASWSYKWIDRSHSQHRFDLLDVNYVYVPWKSENFNSYLENLSDRNSILIKSYEDQLIVRMGYSYIYNSANDNLRKSSKSNSYSVRVNFEESGNLLYLASRMVHRMPKENKGYVVANIPFAQYIKGDVDFAWNWNMDYRNSLVFHIGLGVAYPYGNSKVLPFEKRYFSGGPNSVRGWSVRSLGPGNYRGMSEGNVNYINQTGDIKLDMNMEFRTDLFWKFKGAIFVDMGNIWNIRNYDGQEEGTFKLNRFYKQLAVAYGLGIRLDLDYLIIRFDGGMKAVNPMCVGKDKYPLLSPKFNRDFAFHFAVGYPF